MFTCTKKYDNLPFAHRQYKHTGHCSMVHGHNWSFEFTFEAKKLAEETGFVVDFGGLKPLRRWLEEHFDHTLVLSEGDPLAGVLCDTLKGTYAKVVVVPNCGAEGLAIFLFKEANIILHNQVPGAAERGVRVLSVTVHEDNRNSATYHTAHEHSPKL